MKNFLKNNWFRIAIIIILVSSLIIVYLIYQKRQHSFLSCVEKSQLTRTENNKAVTKAWVEEKVTRDWSEQNYEQVKEMYNNDIKDCLLIK